MYTYLFCYLLSVYIINTIRPSDKYIYFYTYCSDWSQLKLFNVWTYIGIQSTRNIFSLELSRGLLTTLERCFLYIYLPSIQHPIFITKWQKACLLCKLLFDWNKEMVTVHWVSLFAKWVLLLSSYPYKPSNLGYTHSKAETVGEAWFGENKCVSESTQHSYVQKRKSWKSTTELTKKSKKNIGGYTYITNDKENFESTKSKK